MRKTKKENIFFISNVSCFRRSKLEVTTKSSRRFSGKVGEVFHNRKPETEVQKSTTNSIGPNSLQVNPVTSSGLKLLGIRSFVHWLKTLIVTFGIRSKMMTNVPNKTASTASILILMTSQLETILKRALRMFRGGANCSFRIFHYLQINQIKINREFRVL